MASFRSSTPILAEIRSRRSDCCVRCCCRHSIRSARSGSSWSNSTITCSIGGSWGWGWTSRCGCRRSSRRTATGCSMRTWRVNSALSCSTMRRFASCCRISVDGTQIQAWASMKSFRSKDGSDNPPDPGRNGERDFRGEKPSNQTHASTTDPEAKLHRKGAGKEAKLSFMGQALMENRNGLVVEAELTEANGYVEREAAEAMIVRHSPGARRLTLGADKAYDATAFVADLRALNMTPHIAQNLNGRRSAIDGRTTRHPGYTVSQHKRKRIEE